MTFSATARAQPDGAAKGGPAERLWDEAGDAMDKQDYAAACPKLEEVVRLRPDGLGAKIKLAKCYEGQGRLASAWALWQRIEPLAEKANQPERQKTAHDRVEALKSKLATLTFIVPDALRALPGLEVTCDGKVVEPAQWGVPVPVDRGRHVIGVTATARERGEQVEQIEADGAVKLITIGQPPEAKPTPDAKPAEPRKPVWPAVALGALSAGGIASGIAFMMLSSSTKADALTVRSTILSRHGGCVPELWNYDMRCNELQDKVAAETRFHNIGVGMFVAGGAAAAGTALYLLWPSPREKARESSSAQGLQVTPMVGPTGAGALVSGHF